jgi:hypothetical protein
MNPSQGLQGPDAVGILLLELLCELAQDSVIARRFVASERATLCNYLPQCAWMTRSSYLYIKTH